MSSLPTLWFTLWQVPEPLSALRQFLEASLVSGRMDHVPQEKAVHIKSRDSGNAVKSKQNYQTTLPAG